MTSFFYPVSDRFRIGNLSTVHMFNAVALWLPAHVAPKPITEASNGSPKNSCLRVGVVSFFGKMKIQTWGH